LTLGSARHDEGRRQATPGPEHTFRPWLYPHRGSAVPENGPLMDSRAEIG
jgi:hypothetical protein